MISKNLTTNALLKTTYSNYPPLDQLKPNNHYLVTPGSMVDGNFKDPNQWSYTVRDTRHFNGSKRLDYKTSPYNWVLEVGPFGERSDPPWEPAWDRNVVYNMALEKLNSRVRGDLNLTLALAEIRSTARMIAALKRFFDQIAKWGGSKDLANGWLEFQYGWRPLLSDIFGVANESVNKTLGTLQHVKARVTLPIVVKGYGRTVPLVAGLTNVKTVSTGEGKQSCTIKVSLSVPSFDLARWMSFDPVGLAWELIPYSFVVDWFFGVGGYLRSLETALRYSTLFSKGYVSELFAYDGDEEVFPVHTKDWGSSLNTLVASGGRRTRLFVRTKLTSYPFPRKPTFVVDLSAQRVLSAGALLRQIFS